MIDIKRPFSALLFEELYEAFTYGSTKWRISGRYPYAFFLRCKFSMPRALCVSWNQNSWQAMDIEIPNSYESLPRIELYISLCCRVDTITKDRQGRKSEVMKHYRGVAYDIYKVIKPKRKPAFTTFNSCSTVICERRHLGSITHQVRILEHRHNNQILLDVEFQLRI
jgi:hypothetical protein